MKEKINYSPISIISSEQLILGDYIKYTNFAKDNSIVQMGKNFLIKSNPYADNNNSGLYSLVCVYTGGLMQNHDYSIDNRKLDSLDPFGIIPTIPYKLVSKIAKLNDKGLYELGHYPQSDLWNNEKDFSSFNGIYRFIESNKSEFLKFALNEKFSLPVIEDDENQVKVKSFDVYKIRDKEGYEAKVVFNGKVCYKIEPVEWIKYGENLICSKILFYSPVHMKNDYIQNDDIKSFDDTFLKWYIDNIFINDLFKYTDLSYMKEQIPLAIDEDIETKVKEIERLKQIKANLILQQQSEQNNQQHIVDITHDSIMNMLGNEEDIARVKPKIR